MKLSTVFFLIQIVFSLLVFVVGHWWPLIPAGFFALLMIMLHNSEVKRLRSLSRQERQLMDHIDRFKDEAADLRIRSLLP
jgi:hypothetical protein